MLHQIALSALNFVLRHIDIMIKTNVMRILEKENIPYTAHSYDDRETRGEFVCRLVGKSPDETFKTLVTVSNTLEYLVFVIPVNASLDLKKAAHCAGVKSVEMIKQKDLFPVTGYVHGGCSPIGMKKSFRTFINDTAILFDTITFSAGKLGEQVEIKPSDLQNLIGAEFCDLI